VRVSMYKAILMDHLDDNLGKSSSNIFHIDVGLFELLNLVEMEPVTVLHDKQPLGWWQEQFRYHNIVKFLFP
jgi:hypothetical protein